MITHNWDLENNCHQNESHDLQFQAGLMVTKVGRQIEGIEVEIRRDSMLQAVPNQASAHSDGGQRQWFSSCSKPPPRSELDGKASSRASVKTKMKANI